MSEFAEGAVPREVQESDREVHAETEELLGSLERALAKEDESGVMETLQRIGERIHDAWGKSKMPVTVKHEGERYIVYLSSGTSGTRLFLDEYGRQANQLRFPNVALHHKQHGVTLAEAFLDVFGTGVANIGSDEAPSFVIDLHAGERDA